MRCQLKERARSRAHVMSSSLRSKRIYKHSRSCLCDLCKRCWYVFLLTIRPIHHAPGLLFKPYSSNVYQRLQHIVYQGPAYYLPTTPANCLPTTPADCLPTTSILFTNDSRRLFTLCQHGLLFTSGYYIYYLWVCTPLEKILRAPVLDDDDDGGDEESDDDDGGDDGDHDDDHGDDHGGYDDQGDDDNNDNNQLLSRHDPLY